MVSAVGELRNSDCPRWAYLCYLYATLPLTAMHQIHGARSLPDQCKNGSPIDAAPCSALTCEPVDGCRYAGRRVDPIAMELATFARGDPWITVRTRWPSLRGEPVRGVGDLESASAAGCPRLWSTAGPVTSIPTPSRSVIPGAAVVTRPCSSASVISVVRGWWRRATRNARIASTIPSPAWGTVVRVAVNAAVDAA